MTADRSAPEGSSTSRPRRSRRSSRSAQGSSTSPSPGEAGEPPTLGAAAIRELADRHGIRPSKSLGQHFLIDPNLARAIVADAGVGAGDRVVEIGAGLGSLTVALAAAGATVLAVEFDRRAVPALEEVTAARPRSACCRPTRCGSTGRRRSARPARGRSARTCRTTSRCRSCSTRSPRCPRSIAGS